MAWCPQGTGSAIQHTQIKAAQNTTGDATGRDSSWTDGFGEKKKLKVEYCDDFDYTDSYKVV